MVLDGWLENPVRVKFVSIELYRKMLQSTGSLANTLIRGGLNCRRGHATYIADGLLQLVDLQHISVFSLHLQFGYVVYQRRRQKWP